MAVSKKGMRKVNVSGRQYIWSVKDEAAAAPEAGFVEPPEPYRHLHIISVNKQFIVHYRIPKPGEPHGELRVAGPLFPRNPGAKMAEVPRWKHDSKRYPTADFVRRLIGWCMDPAGQGDS